jgi:PAS domain S-box-containing protein
MKSRLLRIVLVLCVPAGVLIAAWLIDRSEQARFHQDTRSKVLHEVSAVRAQLEGALNRRVFLGRGLVAQVAAHPSISAAEFEIVASVIMSRQASIRGLLLAKGSVVSHVYPKRGNEAAPGLDLMADPAQAALVQRAKTTRMTVVGGPADFFKSQPALISYVPIFLRPPQADQYWGLGVIVIDLGSVMAEASLLESPGGLQFSLRGKDGTGSSGEVFYGDGKIFAANPVVANVSFRNGNWQLAAIPANGWPARSPGSWKWRLGGGLLSLLAGLLVWLLAREPERLRRAVEQATTALRESEERYRSLARLSPVGMFHTDARGHCLYVNDRWCELSGLNPQEALGDGWARSVHPEDRERVVGQWNHETQEQTATQIEFRLQQPSGKIHWVVGQCVPKKENCGEVIGYVGAVTDISERRQAEEQARQHQAELAHVLRLSTMGEMASELAHELNQPLTAIANYANGCAIRLQQQGANGSGEIIQAVGQISSLSVRAGEIIRHLRNFLRKGECKQERVQLNDLVREAAGFFETEAQQKMIALRLELANDLPVLSIDPIQIEQVILNLIRNGFDAMNGGHSTARAELTIRTKASENSEVLVSIQDCGTGIALGSFDEIFNPFFTTKPDGMGMGLSISRSIIEAHGGQMWARSNGEGGATFYFTVPLTKAESYENSAFNSVRSGR